MNFSYFSPLPKKKQPHPQQELLTNTASALIPFSSSTSVTRRRQNLNTVDNGLGDELEDDGCVTLKTQSSNAYFRS